MHSYGYLCEFSYFTLYKVKKSVVCITNFLRRVKFLFQYVDKECKRNQTLIKQISLINS